MKPEISTGRHNNIRLTKPRYLSQIPELIGSPKQIEKEYSLALANAGAFCFMRLRISPLIPIGGAFLLTTRSRITLMDNSLITGAIAFICGGGALAVFWKPLGAALGSLIINNRAGGEIITHYKEQVVLLKEENAALRKDNAELNERREKDLLRISHLESDIRQIKTSLRMLIAMYGAGRDEEFRGQVSSMLATLDGESDET